MARAHDVTKNQSRRHRNQLKRIPGNHERGATGHNSIVWFYKLELYKVCQYCQWNNLSNYSTKTFLSCISSWFPFWKMLSSLRQMSTYMLKWTNNCKYQNSSNFWDAYFHHLVWRNFRLMGLVVIQTHQIFQWHPFQIEKIHVKLAIWRYHASSLIHRQITTKLHQLLPWCQADGCQIQQLLQRKSHPWMDLMYWQKYDWLAE